jgi:putative DNA primase/helicase
MDTHRIVRALRAHKSGAGWVARCPAHNDQNPSLSVSETSNGRLLVHCHAGCSQAAVVRVLTDMGLWADSKLRVSRKHVVAEYNYCDEEALLLYQVVRTDPKGFFQRYPDGKGGWTNQKHPRQVLYRLPEVVGATIVFMCEGEKDVETLRGYGFVATTLAGGANAKWLATFTEALRGREVVLVPDNDEPGWALMRRIGTALLGHVVRLICFDDHHRSGAKDITAWFEQGHSETEFINLLERPCHSR